MVSTSVKNIYSVINVRKNVPFHYKQILSCKALKFIADLHLNFDSRRLELSEMNTATVNPATDSNNTPVISQLKYLRSGRLADEFIDRNIKVIYPTTQFYLNEIHTFTESLYIVDFESEPSPNWEKMIEGQINLKDFIYQTHPVNLQEYSESEVLVENIVPVIFQPRSLHSNEENVLINKQPVSAALFDFGLFFFHNTKKLIEQGYAPYFYLPNIGNHFEAKFWDDICHFAEDQIAVPRNITQF